jgi:hypothetical protein
MKNLILLVAAIFAFNSFGSVESCLDSVQSQVNANSSDYYVEVTNQLVDKEPLKDSANLLSPLDELYSSEFSLDDADVAVVMADSEAMGCYGYELVTFNKKTCELLAIGGGYCE